VPSGLKAVASTRSVKPVSGAPNSVTWAASVTFHSRTVLSADPVARMCPSGLNVTA
jgi:hypothetical protein